MKFEIVCKKPEEPKEEATIKHWLAVAEGGKVIEWWMSDGEQEEVMLCRLWIPIEGGYLFLPTISAFLKKHGFAIGENNTIRVHQ